jgi:predicted CopG family antitoxin
MDGRRCLVGYLWCMSHQITITVSDEVYQGLRTVAGDRTISELIEELARPMVTESALEASYRDMILDDERERAASEWIEGLVGDSLPGGPNAPR